MQSGNHSYLMKSTNNNQMKQQNTFKNTIMKHILQFNETEFKNKQSQLNRAIERVNLTIPLLKGGNSPITIEFLEIFAHLQVDQIRDEIKSKFRDEEMKKLYVQYGLPENTIYESDKHGFILAMANAKVQHLYIAMDVFDNKVNAFISNPLTGDVIDFINEKYVTVENEKVVPVKDIDEILKAECSIYGTKEELEIHNKLQDIADQLNGMKRGFKIDWLFKKDKDGAFKVNTKYFVQNFRQ